MNVTGAAGMDGQDFGGALHDQIRQFMIGTVLKKKAGYFINESDLNTASAHDVFQSADRRERSAGFFTPWSEMFIDRKITKIPAPFGGAD